LRRITKQQMKLYVDKKRSDKTFQVGDQVFVKLQPYMQSLVARRANHKLAFRYFKPYQVSRSINTVAFEIALPNTSRIHSIFHVSQLCKALLPGTPTSSQLPTLTNKPVTPVKILATWWKRGPCGCTEKVQVQWSNPVVLDVTLKIKSLCSNASLMHRLGDKPLLKEKGMSGPILHKTQTWASHQRRRGPSPWCNPTRNTSGLTGSCDPLNHQLKGEASIKNNHPVGSRRRRRRQEIFSL
jgi:hypothetical protein